MVQHAEEFEVNGEEVQRNASLLKTLQPWHIRKFNYWLKMYKMVEVGIRMLLQLWRRKRY